jgi:hypothetical protein
MYTLRLHPTFLATLSAAERRKAKIVFAGGGRDPSAKASFRLRRDEGLAVAGTILDVRENDSATIENVVFEQFVEANARVRAELADMIDNVRILVLKEGIAQSSAQILSLVSAPIASYIRSRHTGVNLVALNEVDASLNGDPTKYFHPNRVVVTCVATNNPAYLLGGNAPTVVIATWNAITAPAPLGEFRLPLNGANVDVIGLDFGACLTMFDVADVIQAGIRLATGGLETCTWDNVAGRLVITSTDHNPATTSVLQTLAVPAGAGTDISGVGGTPFMDCDAGSAAIAYLPPAGLAATITVGTTHAGVEILGATVLTGLVDVGQTFEIPIPAGVYPVMTGDATLHVTATVADGVALLFNVDVEVQGTQA